MGWITRRLGQSNQGPMDNQWLNGLPAPQPPKHCKYHRFVDKWEWRTPCNIKVIVWVLFLSPPASQTKEAIEVKKLSGALEKKEYYISYTPEFGKYDLFILDVSNHGVDIPQESELYDGKSSASLNLKTPSNLQRGVTVGSCHFYPLEQNWRNVD